MTSKSSKNITFFCLRIILIFQQNPKSGPLLRVGQGFKICCDSEAGSLESIELNNLATLRWRSPAWQGRHGRHGPPGPTCASFFAKFRRSEDWTAASTDWQLSWQTSTLQSARLSTKREPQKQWRNLGSTSHGFISHDVNNRKTSGCHQPWSRVNSTRGSRRASHGTFHFPWPVEPRASAHHHHLSPGWALNSLIQLKHPLHQYPLFIVLNKQMQCSYHRVEFALLVAGYHKPIKDSLFHGLGSPHFADFSEHTACAVWRAPA